jgi:twitching motility two-component system response regulator PilH
MMTIKKILIVDDSKVEQIHLFELLSHAGFTCRTADNAEDAQTSIDNDSPDLILMDVVMPGQSGFQFARALANHPKHSAIPIVFCTSKNQPTDKLWGMRQGAKDYITKPVQGEELISKILAISKL